MRALINVSMILIQEYVVGKAYLTPKLVKGDNAVGPEQDKVEGTVKPSSLDSRTP